uniref:IncF plasmid conjugative transfer pilus assembly protein TraB n=1 Tax=Klebsiella pneumoniae TaxID=573 RepID=A0A8B0SV93_KLEPN|nr:IncF plasmid conjugative transfer pilus assembly protein TraB [Klebsiella pneumoniae]
MGGDDSSKKAKKIKPVTNLLDTSSIVNMDEEGQKKVFLQTVQQENRKDQQNMLDQVKQMEKNIRPKNSSELTELKNPN